DCYDLLGVTQSANSSEIKKAYYKLSLKHHPDKNPDPESRKIFVKIATAYEILKDEATREKYDYAIALPEEVFYKTAQYYRAYYGHKTDARAVLVGLLVILSGFQYLNQTTRYNQAVAMKKGQKNKDRKVEEDLSKVEEELDLQITGTERPSIWKLIGGPHHSFTLYSRKVAAMVWLLVFGHTRWRSIDDATKEDLVLRCLWEKSNMESYMTEMRKESKRRR
ncbi:unnamed protein product, partial [Vicia faba]